ncbi:hypothetical protein E2C01_038798 [Portunus trituberculatus]|uniref:Uncharacterized protein n=1 Tax=Portunus trituberculatus TaxID=210409 RepID=A0A5B7FIZ9_PORTR|nr:hypothetical protein [Portunus trituberculatus]
MLRYIYDECWASRAAGKDHHFAPLEISVRMLRSNARSPIRLYHTYDSEDPAPHTQAPPRTGLHAQALLKKLTPGHSSTKPTLNVDLILRKEEVLRQSS